MLEKHYSLVWYILIISIIIIIIVNIIIIIIIIIIFIINTIIIKPHWGARITVLVLTTQGELLADQNITLKENIISCHISSFLRLNTISGTNPAFQPITRRGPPSLLYERRRRKQKTFCKIAISVDRNG